MIYSHAKCDECGYKVKTERSEYKHSFCPACANEMEYEPNDEWAGATHYE